MPTFCHRPTEVKAYQFTKGVTKEEIEAILPGGFTFDRDDDGETGCVIPPKDWGFHRGWEVVEGDWIIVDFRQSDPSDQVFTAVDEWFKNNFVSSSATMFSRRETEVRAVQLLENTTKADIAAILPDGFQITVDTVDSDGVDVTTANIDHGTSIWDAGELDWIVFDPNKKTLDEQLTICNSAEFEMRYTSILGFGADNIAKQVDAPRPKITPTIGRMMWLHPNGVKQDQDVTGIGCQHPDGSECTAPLPAIVVKVNDTGGKRVNVAAFTHSGKPRRFLNVPIVQDGEKPPERKEVYLTWMPYQIGQAAKTEALQATMNKPLYKVTATGTRVINPQQATIPNVTQRVECHNTEQFVENVKKQFPGDPHANPVEGEMVDFYLGAKWANTPKHREMDNLGSLFETDPADRERPFNAQVTGVATGGLIDLVVLSREGQPFIFHSVPLYDRGWDCSFYYARLTNSGHVLPIETQNALADWLKLNDVDPDDIADVEGFIEYSNDNPNIRVKTREEVEDQSKA